MAETVAGSHVALILGDVRKGLYQAYSRVAALVVGELSDSQYQSIEDEGLSDQCCLTLTISDLWESVLVCPCVAI
jgi:hypothetical protein